VQHHGISDPDRHVTEDQGDIIAFLRAPETHGVGEPVTVIETHIAVVFLAGSRAYKMKRAVRYPYLDFSSLELRRAACLHEIAVNQPNAPTIYLDAVPITRGAAGLAIAGGGEPVEWIVRMNRFDETATLDHIADAGPLAALLVDQLAETLASAHARAERREAAPWIDDLATYVGQNETAFKEWPEIFDVTRTHEITALARKTHAQLTPLIEQRGRMGHVRRCQGDCHLGNIVLIDGVPTLFDAIEFDDAIGTGDVLYDLAFLLMDLLERGDQAAANRLLTRYLVTANSADHLEGLTALPFYMSVRAGIRAKVTAARVAHLSEPEKTATTQRARTYFDLAESLLESPTPILVAIGGLSGTGKSRLAMDLAPRVGRAPGAVVLRSDVERKRLFSVEETARLPSDAYRFEITHEVYHRLMIKARTALASGQSVILDAVFAQPEERIAARRIADAVEANFHGLWLEAPAEALLARVHGRKGDASDATADVVRKQLDYDLGDLEWQRIDASGTPDETLDTASAALSAAIALARQTP